MSDLFGAAGVAMLDDCQLGEAYAIRVESLRGLIATINTEIATLQALIDSALDRHPGFEAVQAVPGVGPVLAAVFVAEIGDVSRFPDARHLCSWAGLTPKHDESDVKVHRGHITKQGSRLVRWAAVEATSRQRGPTPIRAHQHRVADRRGKNIGRVAAWPSRRSETRPRNPVRARFVSWPPPLAARPPA